MNEFNKQRVMIANKVQESIASVLPILCIVCLLCLFMTPLPTGHMLSFLVGSLFVVAGKPFSKSILKTVGDICQTPLVPFV